MGFELLIEMAQEKFKIRCGWEPSFEGSYHPLHLSEPGIETPREANESEVRCFEQSLRAVTRCLDSAALCSS